MAELKRIIIVSFVGIALALLVGSSALSARSSFLDTPEKFTGYVMKVAARDFPELGAEGCESPLILRTRGDGQLSLDNLYKQAKKARTAKTARMQVSRYLRTINDLLEAQSEKTSSWDDVKPRLRPQIFPADFLKGRKYSSKIISSPLPFSKTLLRGYVIDLDNAFLYVTESHIKKWNADQATVDRVAIENLTNASQKLVLKTKASSGEDASGSSIVLHVMDGYAAARLLLPGVRLELERKLGRPCYVAIPNRDSLVAWSWDCSDAGKLRSRVRRDYYYRDHPLSPDVFTLLDQELSLSKAGKTSDESLDRLKPSINAEVNKGRP